MDWRLEQIVVPVTDVDRAKAFCERQAGFTVDVDFSAGDFRVVQLTPPGSPASIALMRAPDRAGCVQGLHLVVTDVESVREELLARDVAVSEPFHFESGQQVPGLDAARADYGSFLAFEDPDGNGWLVQEVGHSGVARG